MLLFVEPAASPGDGWLERIIEIPDGLVRIGLIQGGHSVAVETGDAAGEAVGDEELVGGVAGSPVSSFNIPSHHRWESRGLDFWFDSSWRDARPSVTVSLRHLRSLRSHPRAVVVDAALVDDDRRTTLAVEESPVSAVVVGEPSETEHPITGAPTRRIDWRGWHVVQVDDPFTGPSLRVLTTHTRAWWI